MHSLLSYGYLVLIGLFTLIEPIIICYLIAETYSLVRSTMLDRKTFRAKAPKVFCSLILAVKIGFIMFTFYSMVFKE